MTAPARKPLAVPFAIALCAFAAMTDVHHDHLGAAVLAAAIILVGYSVLRSTR